MSGNDQGKYPDLNNWKKGLKLFGEEPSTDFNMPADYNEKLSFTYNQLHSNPHSTSIQNYHQYYLPTPQSSSTADFRSLPNVLSSFRRVSLSQKEGHFTSNMAAYNYKYHQSGGDLTTNLQHHNGSLIESPQFPSTADSKYWQNDLTHSSSFSSVSSFQQVGKNPSTTITNYKHHKSGRTMATNVPTQEGSLFGTSHLSSTVDVEYGHTHSSDSQHLLNEGNSNLNQTNKNEWKKYPKQFQGGAGPGFNMRADNHDKHSFTHQKHGNPLKSMQNYAHCNLQTSDMSSTSDIAHIIGPSVHSFPIINNSIKWDGQHTNNASLKDSFSENSMENFKRVPQNKNEVSFFCSVCGENFRFEWIYKCHLRTHKTDAKYPFKCDKCPDQFSDQRGLKHHSLSHGAEPKIRCDICQKGFMDKSNLKIHLRVHATTS